ncbi:hypothetical protein Kfla_2003 [Kribbella flavida DSM 17836]|uniref:Tachylectin 2 domain-containing protein n=1 Tax=Kribbella flavida (strain DSM 17836 / JCM 10339 / NBRC 14399) TaxID=479435 RepID=D2PQW1_KRIFD|nr:hypothetical protein [Kribbella flavida]ADB31094.1 hypothetical protein Kfla_2003 [Kribbella flavida DSM 17836]
MRKSIMATATALAVVATGVAVAGVNLTARPATAALSDVPADCTVFTAAYRTDGQRLSYGYSGRKTSTEAYVNDKLGWVPSAQQQLGGGGSDTEFRSTEYVVHPTNGWLYKMIRHGKLVDGTWRITSLTANQHASGFPATRILAYGYPYLYRVTGSSLYRYTVSATTGALTGKVQLSGAGWNAVKTLVYERSGGTGSAAVDVLIGTKTNGELKEWRINRATPTQISSKILKSSGWASFNSLSTGPCSAHPNGRVLLGITATGTASAHFDAKQTDGVGTDIKGGSLGPLGWTAKAYGQ